MQVQGKEKVIEVNDDEITEIPDQHQPNPHLVATELFELIHAHNQGVLNSPVTKKVNVKLNRANKRGVVRL